MSSIPDTAKARARISGSISEKTPMFARALPRSHSAASRLSSFVRIPSGIVSLFRFAVYAFSPPGATDLDAGAAFLEESAA
ncbi:MAG: hypothetical protein IJ783_06075 [Kiritimatiellae bacterium]|nr:hypothetical protein [Kiritimatiellia bacterium]